MEIARVEVFDWYDGPVTAVIQMTGASTPVLAVLLAFEASAGPRVYGLVKISRETEQSLLGLGNLSHGIRGSIASGSSIRRLVETLEGDMVLIRGDSLHEGPVDAWVRVPIGPNRGQMGTIVDEAVEPERIRFWNALFESELRRKR